MQIQKHLFRISQRSLRHPNAQCFTSCALIACLIGCVYYSIVYMVGTLYILPANTNLSQCLKSGQPGFNIQTDGLYMVYPKKELGFSALVMMMGADSSSNSSSSSVVVSSSVCTIVKGLNTSAIVEKPFEFTWTPNALYLTNEQRHIYNFTNYTIMLHQQPTWRYFFYGMATLLTNELIHNPLQVFPSTPFIKSSSVVINTPLPPPLQKLDKLFRIIKCLMYYIVISFATSLYIYGTIIAAPSVIIIFLRCTKFVNNGGNMTQVYKIFPWIGLNSLIRESAQHQSVKKSSKEICCAIILYFFFLYFVYYAIIMQLATDVFYQKSEEGLEEMMFGFIALVEFLAIVFMRTRPFIKYYPLIHSLMLGMFLVYGQFVVFGLKKNLLMMVVTGSLSLFALMVLQLQIPAQTTWNRTKKYTPTLQRPRIGYLPLFNINWINNLPDEWTLMFPLFGRESFSERELSFADRNIEMLDGYLGVNNQNGHGQLEEV